MEASVAACLGIIAPRGYDMLIQVYLSICRRREGANVVSFLCHEDSNIDLVQDSGRRVTPPFCRVVCIFHLAKVIVSHVPGFRVRAVVRRDFARSFHVRLTTPNVVATLKSTCVVDLPRLQAYENRGNRRRWRCLCPIFRRSSGVARSPRTKPT